MQSAGEERIIDHKRGTAALLVVFFLCSLLISYCIPTSLLRTFFTSP